MNNYPPGITKLPNDDLKEKEYVFEVQGEIIVRAYSENDAEERLKEDLRESFVDSVRNGDVEIR